MKKRHDSAKIKGTPEAWEEGLLGREDSHVGVCSNKDDAAIQEALGLDSITLTLPQEVLVPIRLAAMENGINEKLLMQQVLTRFAESETKRKLNQLLTEARKPPAARAANQTALLEKSRRRNPMAKRAPK